jgi:acetamidase/formamidase
MAVHDLGPAPETLHGHFSRELPAVLRIASGDRVRFRTLDVNWGLIENPDPFAPPPPWPGRDRERDPGHALCGPVWIEGAKPGMTLEVRVVSLRTGTWGWTASGGAATETNTRLGLAAGERRYLRWALDPGHAIARDASGRQVRMRPFLGIMGMPPNEPGRHSTIPPRACGGNIDCKELIEGSRLFLPISVEGALFSAGDAHAVQGDGEVAGPALECPMECAELELTVHATPRLQRPRAHTPAGWITFGFDRDLDEAMAVALSDMLDLMGELTGVDRREAMALASLLVDLRVTQVVNGVRGVHAILSHEALAGLGSAGSGGQRAGAGSAKRA